MLQPISEKKFNKLEELYVFIKEYKTQDKYTHQMIYEPYGKYNIPDNVQEEFMIMYENAVLAGYKLSFAEKHKAYGPIIMEIKFSHIQKEKCYTETLLKEILQMYNKVINKYLLVNSINMKILVLEQTLPEKQKDKYCDSIKIVYPNIITKPDLQYEMREELIKKLKKSNILNEITESINEIINELMIYKYDWLMYGSRRHNKVELHNITHIYQVSHHSNDIFDTMFLDENKTRLLKYVIKKCSIRNLENKPTLLKENINTVLLNKENDVFQKHIDEMYEEVDLSDAKIAKLFFICYPEKFFFDQDLECWYNFNKYGLYSHEGTKLLTARNLLISVFLDKISQDYTKRIDIVKQKFNQLNDREKEYQSNQIKHIDKIYKEFRKRIQSNNQQTNIISQLAIYCKKDKLYEKMDQLTPEVIAFNNGVYDLKTNTFRKGEPEEYISSTTGYEYEPAKSTYIKKLHDIFKEIFPAEDERFFTLQILANGLIGVNSHEIFVCWSGPGGRNGKGLLERLTLLTLGADYCRTINPANLSAKRSQNPSSADSFVFALRNCRLLFIDEISDTMEFDKGRLKSWSGNDIIPVRDLFQKGGGIQIKPKFMMVFLTNDVINIQNPDEAIRSRLTSVSFKYRFVENPDPDNKYEKKVDNTLKSKFENDIEWRRAFFQILVDQYNIYCKNNKTLIIPEKFKAAANKIIELNDPIKKFLEDCCIITKNNNDRILKSQIFKVFNKHYNDNNMSAKVFKDILEKKNIKIHKYGGLYYVCGIKYADDAKIKKNLIPDIANVIIENRNSKELDMIFNDVFDKLNKGNDNIIDI